jgi:hypothetical protein
LRNARCNFDIAEVRIDLTWEEGKTIVGRSLGVKNGFVNLYKGYWAAIGGRDKKKGQPGAPEAVLKNPPG